MASGIYSTFINLTRYRHRKGSVRKKVVPLRPGVGDTPTRRNTDTSSTKSRSPRKHSGSLDSGPKDSADPLPSSVSNPAVSQKRSPRRSVSKTTSRSHDRKGTTSSPSLTPTVVGSQSSPPDILQVAKRKHYRSKSRREQYSIKSQARLSLTIPVLLAKKQY